MVYKIGYELNSFAVIFGILTIYKLLAIYKLESRNMKN